MKQLKLQGLFEDLSPVSVQKFYRYHNQNPQVYQQFKKKTFEAMKRGFKNFGSKGIFEQIRWEAGGNQKKDGYKVNNIYTPMYARLFEKENPQYKGFFRKRKVKSELV